MSKISRSDTYEKSESGGSWFEEFLRICKDKDQVLDNVINKKSESISEVVQQYREMVGLDLIKTANTKYNFISIRQANKINLDDYPEIKKIIDSFCMNSGGTKSVHSIINYLRTKMGNDVIRFSDEDLIKYIEERREHYRDYNNENESSANDVGKVGIEPDNDYDDNVADYYSHGNPK